MSVFFLTRESTCRGSVTLEVAHEQIEEWHIFVDDGTDEMRKRAFGGYHFTVLCGEPEEVLPQVLVDVFAWACSPLLPDFWHNRLHTAYFHLSDAAQAYRSINLAAVQQHLEKIWNEPKFNDQVAYRHRFMMLQHQVLFYVARAPVMFRLRDAACEACRVENIVQNDKVRVVVAIVSERMQSERREAIRRTWGNLTQYEKYSGWNFNIPRHVRLNFYIGQGDADPPDLDEPDMVVLKVRESYRRMNIKVLQMMVHVATVHPDTIYLVRADDDIYLRVEAFFWMVSHRSPFAYWWGNFDHGSSVVRNA